MINTYVEHIRSGRITIEDVPPRLRDSVEHRLQSWM